MQSLRFAELCSSVELSKGGEKDVTEAVREALGRIDAEIKALEKEILQKERWEWRQTKRRDLVNEMKKDMVVCNKDEEMELGGRGAPICQEIILYKEDSI